MDTLNGDDGRYEMRIRIPFGQGTGVIPDKKYCKESFLAGQSIGLQV